MGLTVDDVLVRIVVGVVFDALHRVGFERGVIFVDQLVLTDDHVLPFSDQPVGEAGEVGRNGLGCGITIV